MTSPTPRQLEERLATLVDPVLGQDLVSAKCVKRLTAEDGRVRVEVTLGYPANRRGPGLAREIEAHLGTLPGVRSVEAVVGWKVVAHKAHKDLQPVRNVKNVIAVASGKGGVGKSTVSANLAAALAAEGASVGMLDADIYGPSQPRMLGASGQPETLDGKSLEPMVSHGIQSMSIGYLIDEETAMVWRGPMVTQALQQLLNDTNWRDVDYLIVDLPPGTGDIQLTLSQRIPVTGAVIVTTPQDIALLDARKAHKMFANEHVKIPVLGIVENMSIHVCSNCGHAEHIFGEGGGARMAEDYGVELLGALPLERGIREDMDGGTPTVIRDPDGMAARAFSAMALRVAGLLSLMPKDYRQAFPSITIGNN